MPPAGFEPAILAGDWPQTHALERSHRDRPFNKIQIIIFIISASLQQKTTPVTNKRNEMAHLHDDDDDDVEEEEK
jgi:hypothetical protein